MNNKEIDEILCTIKEYLESLPKDYTMSSCGKICEKEYRHGRSRKAWVVSVKLIRSLQRPKNKIKRRKSHKQI